MRKHKVIKGTRSFRFEELPQGVHDELVREYWKTWLAAWRVRVKNEAALDRFVRDMELVVQQVYENGSMFNDDGLEVPED
jgi:hypothetical protein